MIRTIVFSLVLAGMAFVFYLGMAAGSPKNGLIAAGLFLAGSLLFLFLTGLLLRIGLGILKIVLISILFLAIVFGAIKAYGLLSGNAGLKEAVLSQAVAAIPFLSPAEGKQ